MAITKIHPIKSTLNLAIHYISNGDKTDEKILLSSLHCHPKTAHLQMENTRKIKNTKGTVLARHLIQSFFPGEVSPEKAHEIGKALCDKILGNDYEYVLSTHIDRGHIHNHIIFNNVSLTNGKCYQSNKRTYHKIRGISDTLCKENGLMVIDEYYDKYKKKFKTKGKSYKEYMENQKGNSWKSKLQFDIDRAMDKAKSWEDFLETMQKYEYEIKFGKHIAFRHKDKERFTRARTIGEDYTEERLIERLTESIKTRGSKIKTKGKSPKKLIKTNSQKMQENKGLELWAKRQNLKLASNTLLEIKRLGIHNTNELDRYVKDRLKAASVISEQIKAIEKEMTSKFEVMELANSVMKYKKYNDYMMKNKDDTLFRKEYKTEIESYQKALKELKKLSPEHMPDTKEIYEALEQLDKQKESLYTEYKDIKDGAIKLSEKRTLMEEYMKKDVER